MATDQTAADESNQVAEQLGLVWKTRLASDVSGFLDGLPPVDEPMQQYLGVSARDQRFIEFGGVLRKPVTS